VKEENLREFGGKLKKIRQDKNVELKNISDKTKININFLKSMEDGDFNFLPELYVRSFLKLYLQELGEDTTEFLSEYDSIKADKTEQDIDVTVVTDEDLKNIEKPDQLRDRFSSIIKKMKPFIRQMNVIWIVLAALIVFIMIYALAKEKKEPQIIRAGSPGKILTDLPEKKVDTTKSVVYSEKIYTPPKELDLELRAIAQTWLEITIDDSLVKDQIFDSGMIKKWRAREKFALHIGNAAGIRLVLNGKDLGSLGDKGEVIKIDLTENGIQN
jgi:cytoskeletal protein RodZ